MYAIFALYLLLSLPGFVNADTQGAFVWRCSGNLSAMSFSDCQRTADKKGCFYLRDFSQYRPCSSICDGVIVDSIPEERCKAYCLEFWKEACIQSSRRSSTTERTTSVTETSSMSTNTPAAIYDKPTNIFYYLAVIMAASIIILLVLLYSIYRNHHQLFKALCQCSTKPERAMESWPVEASENDIESGLDSANHEVTDDEINRKNEITHLAENSNLLHLRLPECQETSKPVIQDSTPKEEHSILLK